MRATAGLVTFARGVSARPLANISWEQAAGDEVASFGDESEREVDTTLENTPSRENFNHGALPSLHRGFDVSQTQKPQEWVPITITHPQAAESAAQMWCTGFQGRTIYAVKANPCPLLLTTLYNNGIRWFDVASINEIRLVARSLSDLTMCFMNPVKPEGDIRDAYWNHSVRVFSLDSMDELAKLQPATNLDGRTATDLILCVRLGVTSRHARLSLGSKFGVHDPEARELLIATRGLAARLGICFHVGT